MRFWLGTLLVLTQLCGCRKAPEPLRGASSGTSTPLAASSEPIAAAGTAAAAPPSYPADLNLTELQERLGCAKGGSKNACALCKEFSHAGRFTGNTPSGEGRWFGRAYVIENGVERVTYWALLSRHVPTSRVGPSSLPLMISIVPIADDLTMESGRLWGKMSRGRHNGNRKNLAFRFVESFEPKDGRGAINTTGTSVQLISGIAEDIGYLRQPALKRLLLVRPARGVSTAPGDGTYAELWQATW